MSTEYRPICLSVDISADTPSTCRSTDRLVCGSVLGRHLGRYFWIDCRWCIGRVSVVSEYCSRLFSWHSFHLLAHRGRERRYITYSPVLTGQDAAQTAANSNTYLFAVLLEGVRVCSGGIAVFAEQRTTFTRPQSAILQNRDWSRYWTRTKFLRRSHLGGFAVSHSTHNPGFLPLISKIKGRLSKFSQNLILAFEDATLRVGTITTLPQINLKTR